MADKFDSTERSRTYALLATLMSALPRGLIEGRPTGRLS